MEILSDVLTVDPGWNTGYAFWEAHNKLPDVGMFKVSKAKSIASTEARLSDLWCKFEDLIDKYMPKLELCIIESVQLWEGSLTSMTAARRGDIFKLSMLIGGYAKVCMDRGVDFEFLTAQQWKGQLTKKAVELRVKRRIGQVYAADHITDAVGIGLSLMNNL